MRVDLILPSLKTFLVESFSDRRAHGQYQLELNKCRQRPGENVSNYANRIEELLLKLGESLDEELSAVEKKANLKLLQNQAMNVFIAGLSRDLDIIVKAQKP